MAGLPTVQVHLDDGTGTFPDDITKYVRLADGFSFTRGRTDTESAPSACSLPLGLNNGTGAFTPGSTVLGSPSPIKLDQKIRLREIVNGSTYTRCTGYAKSWAVGWPGGTESTSVVQLLVTDAQARAERRQLRSMPEEEALLDGPVALYTLGDPDTATTAADTSGNQAPNLAQTGSGTSVVFGTDPGATTDQLTAATFAGGKYLTAAVAVGATPGFVFGFRSTSAGLVALFGIDGAVNRYYVTMNAGVLSLDGTTIGVGGYNDGQVHVIALRHTGASTVDVIIDGALTDSGVGTLDPPTGGTIQVGGAPQSGAATLTGTMFHVGVHSSTPSQARLIAESMAILNGFAGESGTDRITRLAGYAGIPVGTLDSSLTNVPFGDITGQSAWAAIQDVVDAEMGIAFIGGDGNLTFHNRNRSPAKTAPDLILPASKVRFDSSPTTDDQDLLNYMDTTASATGVQQVARNAASETSHGRYPESKTYLVSTDAEALDRANWLVAANAEPPVSGRYGSLTVLLYGMTPAQAALVLSALEPNCWLRITNMPTQTPSGTTVDLVVQGITETQNEETWEITCNVVARSLFQAWILGDTTYGVLDSTTKLYV